MDRIAWCDKPQFVELSDHKWGVLLFCFSSLPFTSGTVLDCVRISFIHISSNLAESQTYIFPKDCKFYSISVLPAMFCSANSQI